MVAAREHVMYITCAIIRQHPPLPEIPLSRASVGKRRPGGSTKKASDKKGSREGTNVPPHANVVAVFLNFNTIRNYMFDSDLIRIV